MLTRFEEAYATVVIVVAFLFFYGIALTSEWAVIALCTVTLFKYALQSSPGKLSFLDAAFAGFILAPWVSVLQSDSVAFSSSIAFAFLPAAILYLFLRISSVSTEKLLLGLAALPPALTLLTFINYTAATSNLVEPTYLLTPNDSALLIALSYLSVSGFSILKYKISAWVIAIVSILPSFALAIWLESRTALVAGAVAACVLRLGKASTASSFLLVAMLIGLAIVITCKPGDFMTRIPLWLHGLEMWAESPFLGIGPGGFALKADATILEIADHHGFEVNDTRRSPWLHSLYVEALVERGILGLMTLVLLLTSAYYYWLSAKVSDIRMIAVICALTVICVAGLNDLSTSRILVPVLFALIIFLLTSLGAASTTQEQATCER